LMCCLRCPINSGYNTGHVPLESLPKVKLDTSHMGNDVVIVKSGKRICGTGGSIANAPLVQDKSYFEAKLQSTGIWGIGIGSKKCNLNTIPLGTDEGSWVLRHDGVIYHNNEEKCRLQEIPQEGDIIGVTFDHIELNFYINGEKVGSPTTGVKGTIYPIFYVDDGAIIDVHFEGFYHPPPPGGFGEIMIEKSLL